MTVQLKWHERHRTGFDRDEAEHNNIFIKAFHSIVGENQWFLLVNYDYITYLILKTMISPCILIKVYTFLVWTVLY